MSCVGGWVCVRVCEECGIVKYSSQCRDIPPVSLYRPLGQKSKTQTCTDKHMYPSSLSVIYCLYLYLWRRGGGGGGGRGIGECREMGQEIYRGSNRRNGGGGELQEKSGRPGRSEVCRTVGQPRSCRRIRHPLLPWQLPPCEPSFGPMLTRPHREEAHTQTLIDTTLQHALKLPHCLPTPPHPSTHPLSLRPSTFSTSQQISIYISWHSFRQADVQSIESFPSLKNFSWQIRDQSPS